jgi:hypothetical protein
MAVEVGWAVVISSILARQRKWASPAREWKPRLDMESYLLWLVTSTLARQENGLHRRNESTLTRVSRWNGWPFVVVSSYLIHSRGDFAGEIGLL